MPNDIQQARDPLARVAVWPGLEANVPKPLMPYSPGIRAGGWVFIAGTIASDFKTGLAPSVKSAPPYLDGALATQARYVLTNLVNTIAATGCDAAADTVRLWQWPVSEHPTAEEAARGLNDPQIDASPLLRIREEFYGKVAPPGSIGAIKELLCRGTLIEIDMICIEGGQSQIIDIPGHGRAGHAAALRRGDWIFTSAQSANALFACEEPWLAASAEAQTDAILDKLAKIAEASGSSLARAVKADVHIGHPSDFAGMERAWKRHFPNDPPARVVTPYVGLGGTSSRVEVALTLLASDATIGKRTIHTDAAPKPFGHEPQAIHAGPFLFFSTQMAFDSSGNLAPDMLRNPEFPWYGSPGKAQMRYMMENISAICAAAGTTVDQITRRVCFHSDFQWFQESIDVWASYFPDDKPASTTIRIGGPLVVPGANTLLDLIAYVPG
jgi:enamine deaminase RidA (YjgF/YER057c/UK114 family)